MRSRAGILPSRRPPRHRQPQFRWNRTAISAPLAALSENWPEGLRMEIMQSNLANAQVCCR